VDTPTIQNDIGEFADSLRTDNPLWLVFGGLGQHVPRAKFKQILELSKLYSI